MMTGTTASVVHTVQPRSWLSWSLTLAMVLACATGAFGAQAAQSAPPSDAELQARVDAIAHEHLGKPGAAGLSIGVARGGRVVVADGFGYAELEFESRANKDTMFRIGSVTKQFTAAAIMKLVEQGRLNLDDTLTKFLPDYPTHGHAVTVRHLLNHTSGIKSYTDLGEEWTKLWPLELSHEELLALVKDKPFDFAPGEKWQYNNTAYYMLGMIIEKITGKTYAQHLQDELFTPLQLERTRYDVSRELIKNRAQGYSYRRGVLSNDAPLGMSQPGAGGALLSTGHDLVLWSMALTSGKVVTPESFALMTTPTILPDGRSTDYGFGLAIDEFASLRRVQHGGGIHGFNSMLLWIPDADLHIAVISNGEVIDSGKIADDIAYAALGIQKVGVKDEPINADLLQTIVGSYVFNEVPVELKVWDEAGTAMVQAQAPGQGAFRIMYQGPDAAGDGGAEFRAEFDHDIKLTFAADGGSLTLLQRGTRLTAKRKE